MPTQRFGTARKLPSGRWQARYRLADGRRLTAPSTFTTKSDALAYLAAVQTDLSRGVWQDPERVLGSFGDYAEAWLVSRRVKGKPLSPVTLQLYARRLKREILPTFGTLPLEAITSLHVRQWHARTTEVGGTTAAQAYRLLHAILATAVSDGALTRNPCQLRGAGLPDTPERPLVDRAQLEKLTAAMPVELRGLVGLAFWGGLRLGELLGLEVRDIVLDRAARTGTVRIERQHQEVDGKVIVVEPKAASRRTVNLPAPAVELLARHLELRGAQSPRDKVFLRRSGGTLRGFDVHRHWRKAREQVGLPELHVHDLRHGGLTLAAQSGASLAEVMRRAGHSTSKAAMVYQHATDDRDAEVARRMGLLGGPPEAD